MSAVDLHPLAAELREALVQRVGEEKHSKSFPLYDWQRISYAFGRIPRGDSLLEVGPGKRYLTQMLAKSRRYQRQAAIDIVDHTGKMPKQVEFRQMSVAELDFPDKSFDTVLCMEVLEHLDTPLLQPAIDHLRRVCRGRLIMSVPYLEPLPLPSYHLQRFDTARVLEMFPHATMTVLFKEPVTRVPWLLLEERFDR
ncbi:bifunctional 2-polyprenyl-6-hydroxyphenol methylase/3-demethylubiquinol 3-O-methyltransferase UbiG [Caulobacter sp. 17J80-11]|uniref:class I SAM-dependent methyltransferase n=1 Tax=Caulobacter sp. 17J80-11 TaxID=2763502 RepID=UPI0016539C9A|nr:class I SAM-dependent methyltransferase [Caulobacter sp. 17J80-11]MBC6981699.1 class I SAM-dependent methyltransferase [Caulobacter sp. 17J80-11]